MLAEHQECWLGSFVIQYPGVTSIAKEPYNCLILQGVQTPVPYPLPPPLKLPRFDLFLEPNEPAHKILDSFCTCRIYEHQRHSLTVYL